MKEDGKMKNSISDYLYHKASINKILNAKTSRRKACLDYIRNINLQERG